MGRPSSKMVMPLLLLLLLQSRTTTLTMALWCVARSEATSEALQTALDYACSAGADCAPLQPQSGLCFLPNTIQAHASYAFNSYYMRRFMAPGSCDFSGTATIAKTDPSYGSCVYPSSPSTAGGGGGIGVGGTTPTTPPVSGGAPPPPLGGGGPIDDIPSSSVAFRPHSNTIFFVLFFFFILKLITIDMST